MSQGSYGWRWGWISLGCTLSCCRQFLASFFLFLCWDYYRTVTNLVGYQSDEEIPRLIDSGLENAFGVSCVDYSNGDGVHRTLVDNAGFCGFSLFQSAL